MLEAQARNDMQDAEVQAKRDAAVQWCRHATSHATSYAGKSWVYLLVAHDAISENMTLAGLANQFRID
jgi:type III restriction enzyme